ncbi:MAG: UDP-N-acetylmuramoyl-L-alanyl-D-glutamate--2,6-diaminopimelate ligase [Candidatus Liptonbacteria bacterium]|nr:UDP-N-acetylmuramoyl-L-alanyl-D-glutamate--2,6-diaminopimelate ligase [Candidatus Liptonbacteria bacterium]
MKKTIRSFTPRWVLSAYHYLRAFAAAGWYKFPSRGMVVIGVTGTKGKTTAANFLWAVLQAGGKQTGLISTALIRVGDKQMLNPYHMTMPGPFELQKFLRLMVNEGCTHCVIETTSEGLAQWRHIGIWYDVAVFTNLTREHIEAHGSFEAYRAAKGKLFKALTAHPRKIIDGEPIGRMTLINKDAADRDFFLSFPADKVATFGIVEQGADYVAASIKSTKDGVSFRVKEAEYHLNIAGEFNVQNALPAVALGEMLGFPTACIAEGLAFLKLIPGRMEEIEEGQSFKVIVDYAHEKVSMEAALTAGRALAGKRGRVIVLLGAEGGGRDKEKRPLMGELAGKLADFVIVSNVDPYDDDPMQIIEDIAQAAEAAGKERDKTLFCIEDRQEGIRKALSLGEKGDVVLITGKGAEQSMIIKGKSIAWDDRLVVREELREMTANGPHAR